MKIIKYSPEQFDSVYLVCKKGMELDKITEDLLRQKIDDDPDYDPALTLIAYSSSKKPVGFIMGVVRKRGKDKVGYVKLLAVIKQYRRQGIATELYSEVENEMKLRGVKLIRVYESYPNYFMPGVDPFYTEAVCFFERNGFEKFNDCSNLKANLVNQDFNTSKEERKLRQYGIVISRATKKDFQPMINWIRRHFAAWESEIRAAFENKPVSLHIAKKNSRIIAFSAYETNNKRTGWFGPMGTSKAARGKGIGGILLKRCLNDMKKAGFRTSTIPWVGPIPFYMHYVNSKVERVFWRYEKKLSRLVKSY